MVQMHSKQQKPSMPLAVNHCFVQLYAAALRVAEIVSQSSEASRKAARCI